MKNIFLDLQPTYIPLVIQCTKAAGQKTDPSASTLIIYEEDGGDSSFSSTQITGSPFTISKINSKTGLYGVLIAKSVFAAGKYYLALWELTVDGITTAGQEIYFCCNSASFKSTSGGSIQFTYTVYAPNGSDVLNGIKVVVTSDGAGETTLASGYTNVLGQIIFYLPQGANYFWCHDPNGNYTFTNPDTEEVT